MSPGKRDRPGRGRPVPGEREVAGMGRAQLVRLAGELDDVTVVARTGPSPAEEGGTTRRARRSVLACLALSALCAAAFVAAYVLWPDRYAGPFQDGHPLYRLYTPVIGCALGFAALFLGIGIGLYVRKLVPDEVAVQRRHDGPSGELDRRTAAAQLADAGSDLGIARRPLVKHALLGAAGSFGAATGVLALGPFVRYPWKGGDQAPLRITGWESFGGEAVYLRVRTGVFGEIVRVRPEDLQPGAMVTVYPFRESDRGEEDLLLAAETASDTPVMLFRLRPGTRVEKRAGQEDFNYGDYYAFSKICTHLGCAASQYDSQSCISLCPCHQSEFLITESARPVFGPAARPLPQLPITVDDDGYFVARGGFVEPVGPSFWELRSP